MVWELCPPSSASVPHPAWLPTQPQFWLTSSHLEQHQHTLCFHPRDQPELLMLCHFPSHVLLMRHGQGPARFNIPEKPAGQGSLIPLVLHRALCDQIRHGAIGGRTPGAHRPDLLFPEKGNRALPCSSQPPGDLTAGCFVLPVPSPLCYLITERLQLKPRFAFPDPSAGQEVSSQASNYCLNSWACTQKPNS